MGVEHYLAIDIGGTKVLLAVFTADGRPVAEHKIPTPANYQELVNKIDSAVKNELAEYKLGAACIAVPGWIDFENGIAKNFGNLPWENVPVKADIERLVPNARVFLHNDAKLAGLSEAQFISDKYRKVLYLTVSTGIGGGIIIDNKIAPDFENFEPGQMKLEHEGQLKDWEDFASGHALVARYGKRAADLEDAASWKEFAGVIALGLELLLATVQPQVVVFGGGVGAHFEKFKDFLEEDMNAIRNPLVPIPPLIKAHRPEEAVIYGCYEYIKQNL